VIFRATLNLNNSLGAERGAKPFGGHLDRYVTNLIKKEWLRLVTFEATFAYLKIKIPLISQVLFI